VAHARELNDEREDNRMDNLAAAIKHLADARPVMAAPEHKNARQGA
jgi:hypothetical protein